MDMIYKFDETIAGSEEQRLRVEPLLNAVFNICIWIVALAVGEELVNWPRLGLILVLFDMAGFSGRETTEN